MFICSRKSQMIERLGWNESTNRLLVQNLGARETGGWSPPCLNCRHVPLSGLKYGFPGFKGTYLSLNLARISHKCRDIYSPLWDFPCCPSMFSALRGCRVSLPPWLAALRMQNTEAWSSWTFFHYEAIWIWLKTFLLSFLKKIIIKNQSPK